MPHKLSHSSLHLFLECPRCFWLRLNKNIYRPDSIFPTLPAGMDHILKAHFDNYMILGDMPPELKGHVDNCHLFTDIKTLRSWRSPSGSLKWVDEDGNTLRGAVDNILVKGENLIVLDYKTRGYDLKEDTHEHYRDQMDIYTFLLQQTGHKTEDYAYLLFYVPKSVNRSGDIVFDSKLIKMSVNPEHAKRLFKRAISVLNGPMPAPSGNCGFCSWAEKTGALY